MLYATHPPSAPQRGDATPLPFHERSRIRAAALHARRLYPGGVGEPSTASSARTPTSATGSNDALIPRLAAEILAKVYPTQHDRGGRGKRSNPTFL